MLPPSTIRPRILLAAAVCLSALAASAQGDSAQRPKPVTSNAQHLPPPTNHTQAPAPVVRQPVLGGAQVSANPNPPQYPNGGLPQGHRPGADMYGKGQHLTDWMTAHNHLTPAQQQDALSREPGFRELPGPTQERIRNRLAELSTMTPEHRAKVLERNEQIERLDPEQRTQVRGAMSQLGALPIDQRKRVMQSFRSLRGLPPNERLALLNSGRYQDLNADQRAALQRLMQVEPILPRDDAPQGPPPMPMRP